MVVQADNFKLRNGVLVPANFRPTHIRALYESARTTDQNRRRWQHADNLSADAAANESVRRSIRARARYAIASSSYAQGAVLTLANDIVGTGPRLQIKTANRGLNRQIEQDWWRWSRRIRFAAKLRCLRMARAVDGAVIAELVTNPGVRHSVQLDLDLFEIDFLTRPLTRQNGPRHFDGIDYDEFGNPTAYWLLDAHPGDDFRSPASWQPHPVGADTIIHYFRADRPGQRQGVSELQSALELYAILRSYTLATLDAAETAAAHAGILYTDIPAGSEDDPDDVAEGYTIDGFRNMLRALPYGWRMEQFKAEQPTTQFPAFKREIVAEQGRAINMPVNVAAGDSSGYNFASAQLDGMNYYDWIITERQDLEDEVVDRVADRWLLEWGAQRGLTYLVDADRRFLWRARRKHQDPNKVSSGQDTDLANGTATYPSIYADRGEDWETEMTAQAEALGISLGEYQALLRQKLFGPKQKPAPAKPARQEDDDDDA